MTESAAFGLVVLVCALGLIAAIAASALGARIRVPAPALFLVVAAAVSDLVPQLERIPLVVDERIVTVCLVVILFDGGMHIGWRRMSTAAGAITWIGIAGTAVTAAALAAVARFLLGLDWQAALLLGAALSPTDPAVVFAVLGRREVEGRSGTLLEGESGVNDPVGIALLASLLAVAGGGAATSGAAAIASGVLEFLRQMLVGGAVGIAGGLLLGVLMRRVRLPNEALHPLRAVAVAALVFGAAAALGGSGFLAVFVAGILVGDVRAPFAPDVRRFTSGLSSLAEIVAFTVLGLSVSWRQVLAPDVLLPGLALAALTILVVRPLLVGPLTLPLRLARGERAFVLAAGLRGAVPILLGILIRIARVPGADRIAALVFVVVLVSVVVQGGAVPQLARLFRVPMREAPQLPFIAGLRVTAPPEGLERFVVEAGSAAAGVAVVDLSLGPDGRVSLIRRDGAALRVRGSTVLRPGDEVLAFTDPSLDAAELFRAG